jgi:hypothetical protein
MSAIADVCSEDSRMAEHKHNLISLFAISFLVISGTSDFDCEDSRIAEPKHTFNYFFGILSSILLTTSDLSLEGSKIIEQKHTVILTLSHSFAILYSSMLPMWEMCR